MSRLLVVPPVGDPTLVHQAPPGWDVLDLGRRLVRRLTTPAGVDARAARAEGAAARGVPGAAGGALRLRAAAAVLRRATDPLARLHAAALASIVTDQEYSVHVRLDDLDLPGGSTESLEHVAALDARRFPFGPELDAVRQALRQAEHVRCVLDCDQRLPAAVEVAREVRGRLTLVGAYAASHAGALSRLDAFATARFERGLPSRRVGGLPGEERGAAGGTVEAVPARMVAEGQPPPQGCDAAVVRLCALAPEVVAGDGDVVGLDRFARGARAWREAGTPVVLDILVGAPGVGHESVRRSVEEACRPGAAWAVLGLRRFHLALDAPVGAWRSVPLTLGPVDPGLDLARSRPFSAPGTVAEDEVAALLEASIATARRTTRLAPARVAGAVLAVLAAREDPAGVAVPPDVAVVESPTGLDGDGPRAYAVSLERGSTFALRPPVAALLRAVAERGEHALAALDERRRSAVVAQLRQAGLLYGGHA